MHDTIATYRGLTLDPFQRDAIRAIEAGQSVLVSAPTGTGKTLVADYIIEKTFREGRRVIYTAPIKALSNQKFKEFKRLLGDEHVGILTGDVVVQPEAPILIMTTEIFRNLLHTDRERVADVAYVIFDDPLHRRSPSRSVWEESLIFMPPAMRFLGLSATIPNVDELADWIESVQGRPVVVVGHTERAVPLKHHLFERNLGVCDPDKLFKRYKRRAKRLGTTDAGRIRAKMDPTTHMDLLAEIVPEYLPILFFTFSRRRCESHASEAAAVHDLLSAGERLVQALPLSMPHGTPVPAQGLRKSNRPFAQVAYHHAGMLPPERPGGGLFEKRADPAALPHRDVRWPQFPCRTVCFDAVTKWDGTTFRARTGSTSRWPAGRAAWLTRSAAHTPWSTSTLLARRVSDHVGGDVEPLRSRFN